jgi:rare lipoprotein A
MMRNTPWRARLTALALATVLLSGCSETNLFGHFAKKATESDDHPPPASATVGSYYKIGKPYQVQGVWYYPREDYDYDETGIASWYGPNFNAKLTANGETFDQNTVTAAHKTLPLPSLVRVTNLDNGRSLVVRINDRGPFVNGRIIDLSRRSAQLLGIVGPGTAKVRVQILAEESRALVARMKQDGGTEPAVVAAPRATVTAERLPPPGAAPAARPVAAAAPAGPTPSEQRADSATQAAEREVGKVSEGPARATSIYVQAGSFSRYDNALRLSARLAGIGKANISQVSVKGQTIWRVRLGPTATVDEADRILDQVISAGQQDARVVVD